MTKCQNHKPFFSSIKGGTQLLLDIISTEPRAHVHSLKDLLPFGNYLAKV